MEKYFPFYFIALKQYEQIKMSTEDQNYQQVVQIFRRRGFSHRENVHEETVFKIFNELALQNIKREFDDKLFDELISECRNRHFGELSPHNLGILISEAKTILEERLERLHSQVGFIRDRETLIQEKRAQLETKQNSEDIIPDQEKIEHDLVELQKELTEFQKDSNVFGLQLQMIDSLLQPILNTEQKTQIQTIQSKHTEHTNKLPTAFYCTMGCLAMEPILCLIRPSFITILIILHVCYIIFLGYNSRKSVMYLLCELIVNFLLDLLYLIGCFYFNFQFPSSRYDQHSILYTICLSTLIVSSVLRIVVFINFYPFREPKNHSVFFKIFRQEFELHRKSHQAFQNPLNNL